MLFYMQYKPHICILLVLLALFILWAFFSGKNYDSINLDQTTVSNIAKNITPLNNYDFDFLNTPINNTPINNTPVLDPKLTVDAPVNVIPVDNVCPSSPIKVTEVDKPAYIFPDIKQPKKRGRFVSKGERICCQTLEKIYGLPFTTQRPDWLRNPETGEKLELDCYNDDLKIAVEYNGEQHYKWPNFTNQTYQQFINQVRRDMYKLSTCDKNNIYLIVVPYNVPHDQISSYIMNHLPETIQKRIKDEKDNKSL